MPHIFVVCEHPSVLPASNAQDQAAHFRFEELFMIQTFLHLGQESEDNSQGPAMRAGDRFGLGP
jgi:hypothetical protein